MLLTNSQYEHLMSHYYHQQLKDNFILKKRMKEVYDAIPQMNELENRIRTLSVQHAASRLKGQTDSIDLDAEIDKITKQKEALLLQHGYPADYLKPVYECADCKDTGYIDGRKCHCFEKLIVQYLYSQSNLKDVLEHENFSHFNLNFYPDDYTEEATGETPRDNMRHVLETVKSYLSGFSDTPGNLLLYGNTGVGKTFLTNCIAKELLDKSHTVVYLTSLKLFDILESCKFDRDLPQTRKNASLSYLLSSDLLIIDDFASEKIQIAQTAESLQWLLRQRTIDHMNVKGNKPRCTILLCQYPRCEWSTQIVNENLKADYLSALIENHGIEMFINFNKKETFSKSWF